VILIVVPDVRQTQEEAVVVQFASWLGFYGMNWNQWQFISCHHTHRSF